MSSQPEVLDGNSPSESSMSASRNGDHTIGGPTNVMPNHQLQKDNNAKVHHNGRNDVDPQQYAAQIQLKYNAERDKRIRPEFDDQFVKLHTSEQYKSFTRDPWLPADGSVSGFQLRDIQELHFKFVIKGAGYGGLIYASRLVDAGYKPADFAFIDYAGGWGGTWYWNRYPGLMCDVAAEIYMPLLEETGYMPKHKYSYGQELREHAERIVQKYGFGERGIFRATVGDIIWNDIRNVWELTVSQEYGPRQGGEAEKVTRKVVGDFVISMSGVLNYPKLPKLTGMDKFQGHQFHTSRWDYLYTGGSQETPDMINLKDKNVGIVGTGATSIQAFPELAKWAKQIYLFQRTPSAVDYRNQHKTDPVKWEAYSTRPGWQKERMDNFAAFVSDVAKKPEENLVEDAWTHMPTYKVLIGGPNTVNPMQPDTIYQYITSLHALDFERQERVRQRVDEIVKDPDTAQRLKAWYPGWCKRPCFHDDYLPTFNKPGVQLVDTEGEGIDSLTVNGVVVAGQEYGVDLLIWATGFTLSPGLSDAKDAIKIRGRKGISLKQKWDNGIVSLHGAVTRDFPNFFFPFTQSGVTSCATHAYEATAAHTAYLISEAEKRHPGKKVLVEPSDEAEKSWAMRVVGNSAAFAGLSGCTPNYFNAEGRADELRKATREEQMKAASRSPWGQGILDYERITKEWREDGGLDGLDITVLE